MRTPYGLCVAELAEKRTSLRLDVGQLLRPELLLPAADRRVAEAVERPVGRGHVRAEELGELIRDTRETLVADLEQAVARIGRAHGLDVAPPRPRAAASVADLRKLGAPLGLYPEAGLRSVVEPGVVPPVPVRVEPAALEERADDVAAVAHRVHGERLGICLERGAEHVRGLGRLLDATQSPGKADAPDAFENPAELVGRGAVRQRRLPRRHLAEVDEAGQTADRAAEERRPRARASHDEHEPLLAAEPRPLRQGALRDPRTRGAVVQKGAHFPLRRWPRLHLRSLV